MREWKKPEVKVFDVKIDENIAASGQERKKIHFTDGDFWCYVNGQIIVNTSVGWYTGNDGRAWASFAYSSGGGSTGSWAVNGCFA